jgi:hypothetical protein
VQSNPFARDNPFTYGNAIRDPSRFVGRSREVEQIYARLRNPEFESSSVVGDRRIGKTSLLKYIAHPRTRAAYGLGHPRFAFVYVDLQMVGRDMGPQQLWRQLLGFLLEQCPDRVLATALGELLRRERLDTFDLATFFKQADARGLRTVFLLDEFDQVTTNPNFDPDFYFGFRSLAIAHKIALVTSSRLELVELCHSDSVRSSPFFNIFSNISLRTFSDEEVRSLVGRALAPTDLRFTAEEGWQVLDLAGRHPFFLQVACAALYDGYGQRLDGGARQRLLADQFQLEAVPHFMDFWGNSSESHKITLTAAALLEFQAGRPGFSLGELRRLYSRADQITAALERRGLVTLADDGYRLFSSALGPWIVIDQTLREVDDRRTYREWLASNKGTRGQIRGRRNKPLRQVLPKVGRDSRDLIVSWARDPQSIAAMAHLLKSVLNMVH